MLYLILHNNSHIIVFMVKPVEIIPLGVVVLLYCSKEYYAF